MGRHKVVLPVISNDFVKIVGRSALQQRRTEQSHQAMNGDGVLMSILLFPDAPCYGSADHATAAGRS